MMIQLALVSETAQVSLHDVTNVSAAIQKQVLRDLGPIWNLHATLDPFESLNDVPLGYWPVIVVDDVPGSGTHLDRNGQPYALVEAGLTWSLAASHEILEMLVDPFGNRLVAGQSPDPSQGRVEFLVEICDPCQDARDAYTCNGFLVSDFFTPSYFDPVAASNVRYSFGGTVRSPREVLRGGCLSWRDPVTGNWHQLNRFGDRPQLRKLGPLPIGSNLRSTVDTMSPRVQKLSQLKKRHSKVAAAIANQAANAEATRSGARSLRELLASHLRS